MSVIHSTFPRTQFGLLNEGIMYAMVLLLAFGVSIAMHYLGSSEAAPSAHADSQAVPGGLPGRQSSNGISSAADVSGMSITTRAGTTADNSENVEAVETDVQVTTGMAMALQDSNRQGQQNRRISSDEESHSMNNGSTSDGDDAAAEQVMSGSPANDVIHISSDGGEIDISNGSAGGVLDSSAPPNDPGSDASSLQDSGAMSDAAQEPETQQADYEELYPGCPRTLPKGSDEQMAAERMQLYGCRYLESCDTATEEREASCTWYLMGATSQPISRLTVDSILAGNDPVKWQMLQGAGLSLF